MHRECRECFPRHRLQRKPIVSDHGMHHGKCVTHVPWCMSASLTRGVGENVPGIPGACTTRNFTQLARGPLLNYYNPLFTWISSFIHAPFLMQFYVISGMEMMQINNGVTNFSARGPQAYIGQIIDVICIRGLWSALIKTISCWPGVPGWYLNQYWPLKLAFSDVPHRINTSTRHALGKFHRLGLYNMRIYPRHLRAIWQVWKTHAIMHKQTYGHLRSKCFSY